MNQPFWKKEKKFSLYILRQNQAWYEPRVFSKFLHPDWKLHRKFFDKSDTFTIRNCQFKFPRCVKCQFLVTLQRWLWDVW